MQICNLFSPLFSEGGIMQFARHVLMLSLRLPNFNDIYLKRCCKYNLSGNQDTVRIKLTNGYHQTGK